MRDLVLEKAGFPPFSDMTDFKLMRLSKKLKPTEELQQNQKVEQCTVAVAMHGTNFSGNLTLYNVKEKEESLNSNPQL